MANAAVQVTIKPFTDGPPTVTPASGSGGTFQYASFAAIKELQTTLLTDMSSGTSRITLTQPQHPLSPAYVRGEIKIGGHGKVKLNMTVVDDASTPVTYSVSGLLFTPRSGAVTQFPDFTCNPNGSIDLDDAFTACGSYSFLLVIQNTSGGVAAIDPQINNQP